MSEKPRRQPITDGEREILFQIQQLQAKWFDTFTFSYRYGNNKLYPISPQK